MLETSTEIKSSGVATLPQGMPGMHWRTLQNRLAVEYYIVSMLYLLKEKKHFWTPSSHDGRPMLYTDVALAAEELQILQS